MHMCWWTLLIALVLCEYKAGATAPDNRIHFFPPSCIHSEKHHVYPTFSWLSFKLCCHKLFYFKFKINLNVFIYIICTSCVYASMQINIRISFGEQLRLMKIKSAKRPWAVTKRPLSTQWTVWTDNMASPLTPPSSYTLCVCVCVCNEHENRMGLLTMKVLVSFLLFLHQPLWPCFLLLKSWVKNKYTLSTSGESKWPLQRTAAQTCNNRNQTPRLTFTKSVFSKKKTKQKIKNFSKWSLCLYNASEVYKTRQCRNGWHNLQQINKISIYTGIQSVSHSSLLESEFLFLFSDFRERVGWSLVFFLVTPQSIRKSCYSLNRAIHMWQVAAMQGTSSLNVSQEACRLLVKRIFYRSSAMRSRTIFEEVNPRRRAFLKYIFRLEPLNEGEKRATAKKQKQQTKTIWSGLNSLRTVGNVDELWFKAFCKRWGSSLIPIPHGDGSRCYVTTREWASTSSVFLQNHFLHL